MKTHCIIKPHNAGLFSLINNVITCMELFDSVAVDWHDVPNYAYDGNLWDALFAPLPTPPLDEAGEVVIVKDYPDFKYTGGAAAALYESGDEWRYRLYALWLKLMPSSEVRLQLRRFRLNYVALDVAPHLVTVLVSSDYHAAEQAGGKSQSLEDYDAAIRANLRPDSALFIACGAKDTEYWFRARFPQAIFTDARRTETRATDSIIHLNGEKLTVRDAQDCLIDVLLLAMGNVFIHPVSNMATAALYMNPSMKSVYLK